MDLKDYLETQQKQIQEALNHYLPSGEEYPPVIHQAIRYSLERGKRIRPILALAACEAVGGVSTAALPAACAIEMVHAFSLVHDDLPCLDNDDVRRGQPTVHRKFGEAVALLTGDALLTLAFELIAKADGSAQRQVQVMSELTRAIGTQGMIGGQIADLEAKGKELDLPKLEYIHTHKTGALIAASVKVGGILGGGTPRELTELLKFGEYIGFTFQIVDDIMDNDGYCLMFEMKGARAEAEKLTAKAKKHLEIFGKKGQALEALADFILNRDF